MSSKLLLYVSASLSMILGVLTSYYLLSIQNNNNLYDTTSPDYQRLLNAQKTALAFLISIGLFILLKFNQALLKKSL
jgi:hypothetical protein